MIFISIEYKRITELGYLHPLHIDSYIQYHFNHIFCYIRLGRFHLIVVATRSSSIKLKTLYEKSLKLDSLSFNNEEEGVAAGDQCFAAEFHPSNF